MGNQNQNCTLTEIIKLSSRHFPRQIISYELTKEENLIFLLYRILNSDVNPDKLNWKKSKLQKIGQNWKKSENSEYRSKGTKLKKSQKSDKIETFNKWDKKSKIKKIGKSDKFEKFRILEKIGKNTSKM